MNNNFFIQEWVWKFVTNVSLFKPMCRTHRSVAQRSSLHLDYKGIIITAHSWTCHAINVITTRWRGMRYSEHVTCWDTENISDNLWLFHYSYPTLYSLAKLHIKWKVMLQGHLSGYNARSSSSILTIFYIRENYTFDQVHEDNCPMRRNQTYNLYTQSNIISKQQKVSKQIHLNFLFLLIILFYDHVWFNCTICFPFFITRSDAIWRYVLLSLAFRRSKVN